MPRYPKTAEEAGSDPVNVLVRVRPAAPQQSLRGERRWTRSTRCVFERTSKRRRGYPSETCVGRGLRVVHGDKELSEKLGRDDPCPCGSGKRFQAVLPAQRPLLTMASAATTSGTDRGDGWPSGKAAVRYTVRARARAGSNPAPSATGRPHIARIAQPGRGTGSRGRPVLVRIQLRAPCRISVVASHGCLPRSESGLDSHMRLHHDRAGIARRGRARA